MWWNSIKNCAKISLKLLKIHLKIRIFSFKISWKFREIFLKVTRNYPENFINSFKNWIKFFGKLSEISLMITWPALCPAGSTFCNKIPKSQLLVSQISSSFFCAVSTGITESNRMQYSSFHRTNISKLNFASGRTSRTACPASSTLVKLSLKIGDVFLKIWWNFLRNTLNSL